MAVMGSDGEGPLTSLAADEEPHPTASGAVEEFRALRTEIDRRSTAQQAIVGLQLTASASLAGVAAAHTDDAALLLIIGPLSLLLLLQWLDHHRQITRIGLYFRTEVEPRAGLAWEHWNQKHGPGRIHRWTWITAYYLLFPGFQTATVLTLPFVTRRRPDVGVAFWWLDLVLTALSIALLAHAYVWSEGVSIRNVPGPAPT